jgi:hypothetical protein
MDTAVGQVPSRRRSGASTTVHARLRGPRVSFPLTFPRRPPLGGVTQNPSARARSGRVTRNSAAVLKTVRPRERSPGFESRRFRLQAFCAVSTPLSQRSKTAATDGWLRQRRSVGVRAPAWRGSFPRRSPLGVLKLQSPAVVGSKIADVLVGVRPWPEDA